MPSSHGRVAQGRTTTTGPFPGQHRCPEPPIGKKKARRKAQKHRNLHQKCFNYKYSLIIAQQGFVNIRYSLAGQDTRLSPERPGFESRWRNSCMHLCPVSWSHLTAVRMGLVGKDVMACAVVVHTQKPWRGGTRTHIHHRAFPRPTPVPRATDREKKKLGEKPRNIEICIKNAINTIIAL